MYITTIILGDLCDNIGLVGVSAKWSYVTASPSHHDQAIPMLSSLLFMHVGHPYIPLFKSRRIFEVVTMYMHICIISTSHSPSPPLFPHCSITMRFVTKKLLIWPVYMLGTNLKSGQF